jgi:hypothetical protein
MYIVPTQISMEVAGVTMLIGFLIFGIRTLRTLSKFEELSLSKSLWLPVIIGGMLFSLWPLSSLIVTLLGGSGWLSVVPDMFLLSGSFVLSYSVINSSAYWQGFVTERKKLEKMLETVEKEELKELEALR